MGFKDVKMTTISIVVGYVDEHEIISRFIKNAQSSEEPEYDYEYIIACDKELSQQLNLPRTKQVFVRRGYTRAFNDGVKHATGDYLVIANSDLLLMSNNWASSMIKVLEETKASLVSTPVNRLQTKPSYEIRTPIPSFLWLMRRGSFIGFDEAYADSGGQYFDDLDYCEELFSQGEKIVICTDTYIRHVGIGYLKSQSDWPVKYEINKELFINKWGREPSLEWMRLLR